MDNNLLSRKLRIKLGIISGFLFIVSILNLLVIEEICARPVNEFSSACSSSYLNFDESNSDISIGNIFDQNTKLFGNIIFVLIALIIFPGATYLLVRISLRQQYQWKKKYSLSIPRIINSPPDDLPPALVGLIIGNYAAGESFLATIFDLANKKVVRLEEKIISEKHSKTYLKVIGNEKYPFETIITQKSEANIFELMRFSEKNKFTASKHQEHVQNEALTRELIKDKPLKYANKLLFFLGIPSLILSFLYLYFVRDYLNTNFPFSLLPNFCLLFNGFVPFIFLNTATLTEKGFLEAAKWRSFSRYLKNLLNQNNITEIEMKNLIKYIPYLQVFRLTDKWLKLVKKNPPSPPKWFSPTFENEYSQDYKIKTDAEYFYKMIDKLNFVFKPKK